MTHEMQHGAACQEQKRIRRRSSLCRWILKQYMGLVAMGDHIAMHTEAEHTGDQWPLVLPQPQWEACDTISKIKIMTHLR